jgi:hypothetical protein
VATYVDKDRVRRAHVQLRAMLGSLPTWSTFPESYVREYGRLVTDLRNAGLDVTVFEFGSEHLRPKVTSFNYVTKEVNYADEPHIDRAKFLTRAQGLLTWLEERERGPVAPKPPMVDGRAFGNVTISGGNVNFGDGSSINVTNVTVMDVLQALERHIQSTVAEPAVKKSVLAKVGDLLRHPAATTALQVGLPELLKKVHQGAGGGGL